MRAFAAAFDALSADARRSFFVIARALAAPPRRPARDLFFDNSNNSLALRICDTVDISMATGEIYLRNVDLEIRERENVILTKRRASKRRFFGLKLQTRTHPRQFKTSWSVRLRGRSECR